MTELLDTTKTTQPFDLPTAVKYMRENGEYIRYHSDGYDFYMYISKEQKPVVVNGKRQLREFEKIYGISQYGGPITNTPLADLLDARCYIMQFDESGNPIWNEPTETNAGEVWKAGLHMWKPEIISMILSASVSVLTLFTFFQSRTMNSERRTAILEERDRQHDKELIEIKKRLDNHDKQNEALIRLTTEITNLSEKVEKIDNKLEELP